MKAMIAAVTVATFAVAALVVASPHETPPPLESPGEAAFVDLPKRFADASACAAHLAALVRSSAPPAFDKAVGPYTIAPGDVRAHRVKAQGWGHDIEEFRCSGAALGVRRWSHAMNDVKPFTIEDIGKMSFPKD